ncbi:MAG: cytochrome c oxidase subunit II [Marinobacter sp.]|uniref:cytochrome c oxidase subunit II n=1 Tax=Marinobacter sp. TaxID=50741 RepID=UPI0032981176
MAGPGISLVLSGCAGEFSILAPAGPNAHSAAWLWWGMFGWFTAVLVGVIALWLFAIKRSPGKASAAHLRKVQKRWIIWGGLALPVSTITVVLAFGLPLGQRMLPQSSPEGGELRIEVTAHQWWWEVNYPDSGISLRNELHIPAGRPVNLHLTSADVIHSFWVPRLGGKLDAIPGHTNILRLHADEAGTYRGQCAEFCGRDHAHMGFTVTAHEPSDYQQWVGQEVSDE